MTEEEDKMYWYNYKTWDMECKKEGCGWMGNGSETTSGDMIGFEGLELLCPVCLELVNCVWFPTFKQVEKSGTEKEKKQVKRRKDFLEKVNRKKLKPDQIPPEQKEEIIADLKTKLGRDMAKYICSDVNADLPSIPDESFVLHWTKVGEEAVVVYKSFHGDTTVCSEMCLYEGYCRFESVAIILQKRYGVGVLTDLIPDPNSQMYLYGDASGSVNYVKDVREKLGKGIDLEKDFKKRMTF